MKVCGRYEEFVSKACGRYKKGNWSYDGEMIKICGEHEEDIKMTWTLKKAYWKPIEGTLKVSVGLEEWGRHKEGPTKAWWILHSQPLVCKMNNCELVILRASQPSILHFKACATITITYHQHALQYPLWSMINNPIQKFNSYKAQT